MRRMEKQSESDPLAVVGVRVSIQHKTTTTTTSNKQVSTADMPVEKEDEEAEYASAPAASSHTSASSSLDQPRRAMDGWLTLVRERKHRKRHETIAELHVRFSLFKRLFTPWKQITATQRTNRRLQRAFRIFHTATVHTASCTQHAEELKIWRRDEQLRDVLIQWRQVAVKQKRAFDTHLLAGLFRWQVLVGGVFTRWKQHAQVGASERDRAVLHWAKTTEQRAFGAWKQLVENRRRARAAASLVVAQRARSWLNLWRQMCVAEIHWKRQTKLRVLRVNLPRIVNEARSTVIASRAWKVSSQKKILRTLRKAAQNRRLKSAREKEVDLHMNKVRARNALQFWMERTKSETVQRIALRQADAHFVRSRIWRWQTWTINKHSRGVLQLVADRHYACVLGHKALCAWRVHSDSHMTVLVRGARAIERRAWVRWKSAATERATMRKQQVEIAQWRRACLRKQAVAMMLTAATRQWDAQERDASRRETEARERVVKRVAAIAAHWRAFARSRRDSCVDDGRWVNRPAAAPPAGVSKQRGGISNNVAYHRMPSGVTKQSPVSNVLNVLFETDPTEEERKAFHRDFGNRSVGGRDVFGVRGSAGGGSVRRTGRRIRAPPRRGPWAEEEEEEV